MGNDAVIIYAIVATVVALIIAAALIFLVVHRQRQRQMQLLMLAQEEAERRRRKRKKAGLRRWEIDYACPEALVSVVSETADSYTVYSKQSSPERYYAAISSLRDGDYVSPGDYECSDDGIITPPPLVHTTREVQFASVKKPQLPKQVMEISPSEDTCVICLDDISIADRVRALPCKHVYHSQCIRVWLRRKNACPCCTERVIKRRKKRTRPLISTEPIELAPVPTSMQGLDAVRRLGDRCEETVIDIDSRGKSFFGRDGVDDASSDRFNSEVSGHDVDDASAAELLYQVRRALRGESSLISLNTSIGDLSESGFGDPEAIPDGFGDVFEDPGAIPDVFGDANDDFIDMENGPEVEHDENRNFGADEDQTRVPEAVVVS